MKQNEKKKQTSNNHKITGKQVNYKYLSTTKKKDINRKVLIHGNKLFK